MNKIFEWLRDTLARDYKLSPEQLTPDTALEDIGLDSLAIAELLFNVEDAFHITLPSEPVPLVRLADVVTYIEELIAQQHGAQGGLQEKDAATRPC